MGELENLEARVASLEVNTRQLWQLVRDHEQRFDTLGSPLLKRVWFRIQGWPGQTNLNADRPAWRPWHRWVKP